MFRWGFLKVKRKMPSVRQVRGYWSTRLDLAELGFDSAFEFTTEAGSCFACGQDSGSPERAHIKPRNQGGGDDVGNIHILCRICHKDSELLEGEEYMAWLYERSVIDVAFSLAAKRGLNIHSLIHKHLKRE